MMKSKEERNYKKSYVYREYEVLDLIVVARIKLSKIDFSDVSLNMEVNDVRQE